MGYGMDWGFEIRSDVSPTNEVLEMWSNLTTKITVGEMADQVSSKIGGLLTQATKFTDASSTNRLSFPLKLQTACSGTDAPALALTIVQEQMERHQFPTDQRLHC